ncbi:threonine/serine dehydratase [Xinfangfangia sp. CPCC 101601]|uniref:Threonine/serine dehydratase n=1 Tax=Pseudogemmobacter lacusdianii TaxID=3069608 RepID=A0ABU0VT07_9RHOB|nr:threonine/serine dehydratase [Xinfangfangia sp. CPCC 101601]MDQ2064848.1 threonine/serine dehydratase [Xinfangfangia sp. CPCC 101601]
MTSFAMIEAAAARMAGHIRQTPLLHAPLLDRLAGRRVLVKAEALQITGSFKARGGWSAVSALPPGTGVLAMSSGNHAQGVAWAAAAHGIKAVILMPSDAPAVKIANTKAYGAEVVLYDRATEDRDAIAARLAAERGLALIPPFDHPQVIAGQGTVGLELAKQTASFGLGPTDVLVPCGGGGLAAGIALAVAQKAPHLRVRTVEPMGFDDAARSLASGTWQRNPSTIGTICDAITTPSPGQLTLPILLEHAGPGLTVSDAQALQAVAEAFTHLRLVAEPGGAVALAAALFTPGLGDTVICVVSGGNIDPALFTQSLQV